MTGRSHLPEPSWGMIGAPLAIGLTGSAVVLSGHASA